MSELWRMQGRKALITGGSRGIGLAVARQFLALGADVALVGRDQARLEWLSGELSGEYPDAEIRALAIDLAYPEDLGRVPAWITEQWGALDVLVNNVGTNIRKGVLDYDLNEYHRIIDANLTSCFELCRQFHSLLKSSPQAAIVNVASVAGLTHIATGAPYAMSKAAMVQLTRNLACEWAADGIRVNTIAPWYIETDLVRPVLGQADYLREVLRATPMGRIGTPEEAAGAITFLALPASGYITGHCLPVDGGFSAFGFAPA